MKLTAKDLVDHFGLKVESGSEYLNNKIVTYGMNRPGLELAGFVPKGTNSHRIMLLSSKEFEYLEQFKKEEQIEKLTSIFKLNIPAFILTPKFKNKHMLEVSKKFKIPVLRSSDQKTSSFTQNVLSWLDEYFSETTEVHASLVNIFGKGVLIIGRSGIGKSELVMDLVKTNHLFVGDDRIVITKKANRLFGKSHPLLTNLIEVRGIGIVEMQKLFGYQIIQKETAVDVVIEITDFNKEDVFDRLGNDFSTKEYLGLKIPYIQMPVSSGRNLSSLIETAVSQLKSTEANDFIPATEILSARLKDFEE
ncbi:HPr kinase/phosphorylase [Spiroplasma sp. TIUS-1]|uniref:HPr(Ser) kinase/phosphatase n=1 Tax=Spiroplasma sp. TIUS-1 TaxID=216963 RepID=UPI0013974D04|nr:HPr(Ser) kinase/phosphatase [Spiroplasma sp. TIUS-1]QHX35613.1 HPr kinase/phosphorylase [Spiroplasma sp. TIUS-1]